MDPINKKPVSASMLMPVMPFKNRFLSLHGSVISLAVVVAAIESIFFWLLIPLPTFFTGLPRSPLPPDAEDDDDDSMATPASGMTTLSTPSVVATVAGIKVAAKARMDIIVRLRELQNVVLFFMFDTFVGNVDKGMVP